MALYCFIKGVSAYFSFWLNLSHYFGAKVTNSCIVFIIFLLLPENRILRKLKNSELNRLDVEGYKKAEKNPVIVVLDNIRSQNNIGSVFRTADAFRIQGVYLCGITARPPHREIQKTALGATETVDWKYFSNTTEAIKELKKDGYLILVLEQTDNSINLKDLTASNKDKLAIILGNEVKGVGDEAVQLADKCVEIPQFGTKHSFNVAVSCGIVLWDLLLKMNRI